MKLLFSIVLSAIAYASFSSPAQAEFTYPYKTIQINCSQGDQTIHLSWNFSVSPFVISVQVDGVEMVEGSIMQSDPQSQGMTYLKEGVFSILIAGVSGTNGEQFRALASIQNTPLLMNCEYRSSWHILK